MAVETASGVSPSNHPSRRVLAKAGFTEIGLAPRYIKIAGRWQDHVLHQRLVDDPAPPAGSQT
jgi:ribosomal-protein-alanine N-acetyltransferase